MQDLGPYSTSIKQVEKEIKEMAKKIMNQHTMLEIVNQLDGFEIRAHHAFDARGNINVLMATNRPDTLDPALLHPRRLDRKIEFGLSVLESRTQIFKIHTRTMNSERDIRFQLVAWPCPNSTGADIRSACTAAGIYAIRARRKTVTEKYILDAVNKGVSETWCNTQSIWSTIDNCFEMCSNINIVVV